MVFRSLAVLFCALALSHVATCQAADDTTREFKAQGLTLHVPKTWTEKEVSSSLRLAQFQIPAAEGDTEPAELVIFPPFGGTVAENIKRWVAQFDSNGLKAEFSKGKVEQGTYVIADLSGTYKKSVGPPIAGKTVATPGYRVVNVMLTTGEGSYFLKLTGPEKTVAASMEAFRKTIGADASKEEKYEF